MTLDPAHGDDGDGLSKLILIRAYEGEFGRTVTIVTASAAHGQATLSGAPARGRHRPRTNAVTRKTRIYSAPAAPWSRTPRAGRIEA